MRSVATSSDAQFARLFETGSLADVLSSLNGRSPSQWPPFPARLIDVEPMSCEELIHEADRLLDGRFELAAEPEVHFAAGIDWRYDPTSDPRRRWNRELHRHRWLVIVGAAYRRTGDERYARWFADVIADWIRSNPPPDRRDESNPVWTLMGVGLRAVVWPAAYGAFATSAAFDRQTRLLMLRSIYDHARFLYLFKTHGNHLLREINGLAALAAAFPEFREADQWKARALDRLAQEIETQVNPDGSHIELSTAYQWLVAEELEAALEILEREGWRLPKGSLRRSLNAIYDVIVHTSRPDGTWPQLNDGFLEPTEQLHRRLIFAAQALDRPDCAYVASRGLQGQPPNQESVCLPYCGLAVMRTGWEQQDSFLLMDAGEFGGAHGHEDKLSIEVYARGQAFLVDPGTYTYDASSPSRAYFVSSNAHNTVTVDGMSQVRRWRPEHLKPRPGRKSDLEWISTEKFDLARARYDGKYGHYHFRAPAEPTVVHDVIHRRTVLFVKPLYWVIVDELASPKPHRYTRLFQAGSGVEVRLLEAGACLRSGSTTSSLYVASSAEEELEIEVIAGCESPIAGWVSNGYKNHREPAPQVAMTSHCSADAQLLTIIAPSESSSSVEPPSIQRLPLNSGAGTAIAVDYFGLQQMLIISDNEEPKRVLDFQTSARVGCFIWEGASVSQSMFQWP